MRAPETGAEKSLARLAGGYIPYSKDTVTALSNRDQRNSVAGLYRSYDDYMQKYEAATDQLISDGYLLADFKEAYMNIARAMGNVFE